LEKNLNLNHYCESSSVLFTGFPQKLWKRFGMNFCLQNLRLKESFPMALSQSQKDQRGFGFLIVLNKSGRNSSSPAREAGDGEVLTNPS